MCSKREVKVEKFWEGEQTKDRNEEGRGRGQEKREREVEEGMI